MSEETRLHIIRTGAEIIHRKGFNNTGIMEILKASGVPKGSFYYYFESKEAFGVEVAKYYADLLGEQSGPLLREPGREPLDRLRNFFRFFRDYFEAQGWSKGCPIGNLSQEMGDLSEQLQAELSAIVERMVEAVAVVIQEAKDSGQVLDSLDAYDAAGFIIGAWHGALMQMKVYKSGRSLDAFEHHVFDFVLKK